MSDRFGYDNNDIVVLTDDTDDPLRKPTKAKIVRLMKWLVDGAAKDDALFFH